MCISGLANDIYLQFYFRLSRKVFLIAVSEKQFMSINSRRYHLTLMLLHCRVLHSRTPIMESNSPVVRVLLRLFYCVCIQGSTETNIKHVDANKWMRKATSGGNDTTADALPNYSISI